ncbi:hypothetical protein AGABI1DRAFT_88937 [Agaricus bisporus var. burnettii JB137-S8]|uniref:Uncharacterized protein n=1 Tax=Agaricus bisporus var. burnettii (strain JB137-S8 / ATCC MYA-4627 / FGSC 10392) TaxID=597362 RepID=K5XLA8_AGABU|nr:uncharacterized protein AGABI1DRAFT_88937 [Agaricus bisporus var. burnettii JB137-S8]EKM84187.1 hypothetical protein AGABI1DRAFT_88937 [Agaricus bisporus var. burnettii JB137-S8]
MTLEDAASPDALLDEDLEEEFSTRFNLVDDEDNSTLTFKDMVKAATPNRSLKSIFESPIGRALPMARFSPAGTAGIKMTSTPSSDACKEGFKSGALFNESILEENETEAPAAVPPRVGTLEPEIERSIIPEDIPLPPSPLVNAPELAIDSVGDYIGDTGLLYEAAPDLNRSTNVADKSACASTPFIAQVSGPDHPSVSISSIEPSGNLIADTSTPIMVFMSSPPSSTIPLAETEATYDKKNVHLRPRSSITSPQDHDRFSVDLNTSFQLHMQSSDLSFDLLNDKMSLFNTQIDMESFLATTEDDPSFDLETEKPSAGKASNEQAVDVVEREVTSSMDGEILHLVDECGRGTDAFVSDTSSATSSPAPATPVDGSDSKAARKRLSIPISTSSSRLVDISPPSEGTNFLSKSPSHPFSPSNGSKPNNPAEDSPIVPIRSTERRRYTLQLTTPKTFEKPTTPIMPLAIPALKIIKRARTIGHQRSDSTTSIPENSNPKTATGLKRLSMTTSSKLRNLPSPAPLRTRKAAREDNLQEKEVRIQPVGQGTNIKCFVPPRPPIPSQPTSGSGPRRVPISEGPQSKSTSSRAATMPSAPIGGPKRTVPSAMAAFHDRSASISRSSGMKPPTRLGTANVSSATSSLPKPTPRASTSRLPAPKSLKTGGLPTLRRVS